MKRGKQSNTSWRLMKRATKWMVSLFLSVAVLSLNGCAVFCPDCRVVGAERCPVMNDAAIQNYAQLFPQFVVDFRVWMGQTIIYCEKMADKVDVD